jgi:hypothetical protein
MLAAGLLTSTQETSLSQEEGSGQGSRCLMLLTKGQRTQTSLGVLNKPDSLVLYTYMMNYCKLAAAPDIKGVLQQLSHQPTSSLGL